MAYNITNIDILASSEFRISRADYLAFCESLQHGRDLPEMSIFDLDAQDRIRKSTEEVLKLRQFPWCGEFSGRTEQTLHKVLRKTKGSADLVLIWEGGDALTGLRVVEGVVKEMHVVLTLVDPEPTDA